MSSEEILKLISEREQIRQHLHALTVAVQLEPACRGAGWDNLIAECVSILDQTEAGR